MTSQSIPTTEGVEAQDARADLGAPPAPPPLPLAMGLIKTARPKQWVKNVLVFAAPAAAGRLFEATVLVEAAVAFAVFCLASIGTYFVNDALDHESDRRHPKKRHRPIAAGVVSLPVAWSVAVVSLASAIGLSAVVSLQLSALICGYVALTVSYSLWLKHLAVIDLACVAAGFVLRMIAGGLATDIAISNWFLTVASFSSLFVVAGKRYAEVNELGEGVSGSRAVLAEYSPGFLRSAWGMAMAVAVASYCQWAFERAVAADGVHIWYQISAVPWVLALLRYALLLERGHGGAPEDVLLSDRVLQVLGAVWLVLFGLGIYDG